MNYVALLQATRFATDLSQCTDASFVVDAQYVINVIRAIENNKVFLYKVRNSDLVCELEKIWDPQKFHIEKIKNQLDPCEAGDFLSMLTKLQRQHERNSFRNPTDI